MTADLEAEIERLLGPGLEKNSWRRDFEAFRERRLWNENYHRRRVRILSREWGKAARGTILDLGTGRGGLAVALAREGYPVVALDLRRNCCRLAKLRAYRYGLDLPAVCARGEELPFRGESFTGVVCRDVLEHCECPGLLLAEIHRVLRPGGSCFVTVINRWAWVDPHYHLFASSFLPGPLRDRYVRLRGRDKGTARDRQRLSELHSFSYREFVRWASSFGFRVRDLAAESLERYRRESTRSWLRWVRSRLLRPFSLHANHFEFLLLKAA